jgi:CBS domain-containing protein
MTNLTDILETKGSSVYCVTPATTVYEAVNCMIEHEIGAVLVVNRTGSHSCLPVGVFTERDYLTKVAYGRSPFGVSVVEVMSPVLVTGKPEDDIHACLNVMTERRVRYLPIQRGDRVLGLVSRGDLTSRMLQEQKTEIDHLISYIQGQTG